MGPGPVCEWCSIDLPLFICFVSHQLFPLKFALPFRCGKANIFLILVLNNDYQGG